MPKSLVRGDYSLLMAVESSSRPNSWYRVLADRNSGALSCDCPPYIFNRNQDAEGHRFCPHTRVGEMLSTAAPAVLRTTNHPTNNHPLLTATQTQWPGLR